MPAAAERRSREACCKSTGRAANLRPSRPATGSGAPLARDFRRRAHRHRRAERLLPGRRAGGGGGRPGGAAGQPHRPGVRRSGSSPRTGTRPTTCPSPPTIPGAAALLLDRDALRAAGALAGALRAGDAGGRVPPRPRHRRAPTSSCARASGRRSTATRPSSRTTTRRRPASPATCATAGCGGSGSPGSPPTSASPGRRSTRSGTTSRWCWSRTPAGRSTSTARSRPRMRQMRSGGVRIARAAELVAA